MRVASVEWHALRIPLREPIRTAAGKTAAIERGLLRVATGDGPGAPAGLGEVAGAMPGRASGLAADLARELGDLDATDERSVAILLERLDAAPWAGRLVRSAVSSAISDLVAQAQGRSLAARLGGEGRASVALNGLIGRLPAARAADRAAALVGEGFTCLKVKGGEEPAAAIVERVATVRAVVGSDVALRLDLNGSLDLAEAEATLARLEPYHLEYAEQPLAESTSLADLARLRRRARVPIAADESVTNPAVARDLVEADAVDTLVVKPARVGGLAEAAAIVELAAQAGVATTVSTLLETGVGLAGALQVASLATGDEAHGLATATLLMTDLLAVPLAIEAGRMAVPHGSGLGIDLDATAVERWRVA